MNKKLLIMLFSGIAGISLLIARISSKSQNKSFNIKDINDDIDWDIYN